MRAWIVRPDADINFTQLDSVPAKRPSLDRSGARACFDADGKIKLRTNKDIVEIANGTYCTVSPSGGVVAFMSDQSLADAIVTKGNKQVYLTADQGKSFIMASRAGFDSSTSPGGGVSTGVIAVSNDGAFVSFRGNGFWGFKPDGFPTFEPPSPIVDDGWLFRTADQSLARSPPPAPSGPVKTWP